MARLVALSKLPEPFPHSVNNKIDNYKWKLLNLKKYVYGKDTFCIHFIKRFIWPADFFLMVQDFFFFRSDILEFSFFFCRNANL
ncbi:hypothetical protein RIR_jg33903.t1 [Rhizophagus irregularis DAOM 181602=DAOM 197198]|nr:hypothetical protein RIR_jg33903.t1 [Rhizophagus irregularis DAOM 181602=DAOM 197198]